MKTLLDGKIPTGIIMKQCAICGHPEHEKFKCTVGIDLFTPHVDERRIRQRNCRCPEDTEDNPV